MPLKGTGLSSHMVTSGSEAPFFSVYFVSQPNKALEPVEKEFMESRARVELGGLWEGECLPLCLGTHGERGAGQ